MIEKLENGYILNINKPPDWSSFDVVRKVRGITGIRKVGHAGTLDPFATGVLLVCLGRATKLSGQLMQLPKEYVAELELGAETDTQDLTGKIVGRFDVPPLTVVQIKEILPTFTGRIEQKIPRFSAAKINGQRSYKLARQGKEIPERKKVIEIHELDLLARKNNVLTFRVMCGRGTYVRTLGADIARKLGSGGFLRSLVRTRIGDYTVEKASTLTQLSEEWNKMVVHENLS